MGLCVRGRPAAGFRFLEPVLPQVDSVRPHGRVCQAGTRSPSPGSSGQERAAGGSSARPWQGWREAGPADTARTHAGLAGALGEGGGGVCGLPRGPEGSQGCPHQRALFPPTPPGGPGLQAGLLLSAPCWGRGAQRGGEHVRPCLWCHPRPVQGTVPQSGVGWGPGYGLKAAPQCWRGEAEAQQVQFTPVGRFLEAEAPLDGGRLM